MGIGCRRFVAHQPPNACPYIKESRKPLSQI